MDVSPAGSSRGRLIMMVLGVVGFLAGTISYLILAVGVASTAFSWMPQPAMGTLITAFQVILGLAALAAGLLVLIGGIIGFREPMFFILLGLIVLFAGPLIFLLYVASVNVWEALPETYEAQASFLFIVATIIVGAMRGSSNDD